MRTMSASSLIFCPLIRAEIEGTLLFLVDSGFCDLNRMEEFTEGGNHFLIRRHPKVGSSSGPGTTCSNGIDCRGRILLRGMGLARSGHTSQTPLRPANHTAASRRTRRRDRHRSSRCERLSSRDDLLTHYLSRWGIEQIFQKVTKSFICRN